MEDSKVAVLLEDLSSQFRVFGEGLSGLRNELRDFKQEVYTRFDAIERRLDRIEHRLDEHDKRFDQIDRRLDEHDKRFDQIDRRLDEHDKRFDQIDRRLDQHDTYFERNTQEHRQLMQAILELNTDIQGGFMRAR